MIIKTQKADILDVGISTIDVNAIDWPVLEGLLSSTIPYSPLRCFCKSCFVELKGIAKSSKLNCALHGGV